MNRIHTTVLGAAATLSFAGSLSAAVLGTVSPTKANGDFIPGSGIPADSFTIETALTGESVALKARSRTTGDANFIVGNRYYVDAGNAPSSTRSAWNFDFQFSPGAASTAVASDYTYEVKADIDPGFGSTNFVTTMVPSSLMAGPPMGDSFWSNGNGGQYNTTTGLPTYTGGWSDGTPFVIANSQNYTFGHLAGSSFTNPNPGEYEIVFTARDAVTNAVVASTTIFAVVPEPASLGLLGVGGLAMLSRRRRSA